MSKWTDKNSILRDLSEAQGREVPVDVVDAVAGGDRPPTPNILEETEEEYFEHCIGVGDALPVPDFGLIKQMLSVVQLSNISDDEEEETKVLNGDVTSITNKSAYEERKYVNITKPKRLGRNAAVESILQAIGKEVVNESQVKKDNKGEVCGTTNSSSLQKPLDNSRLNSPNSRPLALEPVNMFRKKTTPNKVVRREEPKVSVEKNNNVDTYKPSELAGEYYKNYMERMMVQEAMQDDIWTKAEKKMKEIEAKKKLQTSQSTQSSSKDQEAGVAKIWEEVNLAQHRHLLTGDCTVCSVFSLRGYHIDMTE